MTMEETDKAFLERVLVHFETKLNEVVESVNRTGQRNEMQTGVITDLAVAVSTWIAKPSRGGARIVCAARRFPDGLIITGPRHGDETMRAQRVSLDAPDKQNWHAAEEGFIDQRGNFYDRKAAWRIAMVQGQIIYRCGGDDTDGGTLYSENLY